MSPLVKVEIAKNVTAVSNERNEPTIRPTTPKCAPLETALVVPFAGPNSASHRSENDPSDDDPEQDGKQAFPEGEPEEQDREGTQDDGRKGVRSAEGDAEEVGRLGCAVRRGNRLDAVLLDLGDPRRIVLSPRAGNRFFADGHREERTAGQGSEECAEPAELALRARDRSDGILRRLAGRGCF